MNLIAETLYCDRCGVEIICQPVARKRLFYCCQDCANGLACDCGDSMEEDERRKSGME